jgi:hypothetical protein
MGVLMLGWLASIFTGPVIDMLGGKILEAYKARLTVEGDLDRKVLEVAQREGELRSAERIALIGHWYEPVNLMGYLVFLHMAAVILTNLFPALGSVAAIKGSVGEWMGLIIAFYFGRAGIIGTALALRRGR